MKTAGEFLDALVGEIRAGIDHTSRMDEHNRVQINETVQNCTTAFLEGMEEFINTVYFRSGMDK